MEEVLLKLEAACKEPYHRLKDWKGANKKKVIGCLPMYAPEEIIHAAGMLPVIIMAGDESITLADQHMQTNACALVRSTFDMGLKGKLDFLDGMVFPDICDQIQWLAGIWKIDRPFPLHHSLALTHKQDETAKNYIAQVWQKLRTALEKLGGQEISGQSLWQSIRLYNENRALLRRLYDLRRKNPGIINARGMLAAVLSGMLMPKEEHSALLTELLAQAEKAKPAPEGRTRLILAGNPCDAPDRRLLDLVEGLGGVVVDDDLYTGRRYFTTDVEVDGNPIEALASRYVNNIPCSTTHNPSAFLKATVASPSYADYLMEMTRGNKAQGVILFLPSYCDPLGFEYVQVKNKLAAADMPLFLLETEHRMGSLEPLRTRLQAFMEILQQQ